jgi:hypothetical protein
LQDFGHLKRAQDLARAAVIKTNATVIDGRPISSDPVRFAIQALGEAIESLALYLEQLSAASADQ